MTVREAYLAPMEIGERSCCPVLFAYRVSQSGTLALSSVLYACRVACVVRW